MVLLNLLWPRDTVNFARNSHIFGEKIYAFYERQAVKWPFHWSKWWMKIEKLGDYSANRQIKYLFKVAFPNHTEVEALKAMQKNDWPEAYDVLFHKYGKKRLPLNENQDMNHRLRTPRWYDHYVAEFMMQNLRLNKNTLREVILWAAQDYEMQRALREYLASGKLTNAQFDLLLSAVAVDRHGGDKNMLDILIDYIRRYGLEEAYMVQIQSQFPKEFVTAVANESMIYWQSKEVKAFKNTDEGRASWRIFCKETPKIPAEVQALMSYDQYCIFHNVGRKLEPGAVKAFLDRSDEKLWKAVFLKEKDTCRSGEIREFIRNSPVLEAIYNTVNSDSRAGSGVRGNIMN